MSLVIWWGKKLRIGFFSIILYLRKVVFTISARKYCQNVIVFWDFDCEKLIFIENKRHIRNQQPKIHRKLYISSKNNSRQNFTRRGPQGKNRWKNPLVLNLKWYMTIIESLNLRSGDEYKKHASRADWNNETSYQTSRQLLWTFLWRDKWNLFLYEYVFQSDRTSSLF